MKQVDSNLKKKEIMNGLCDQFLKKMSDLYLQHEIMLDSENIKRSDLAIQFQAQMSSLSDELGTRKNDRQEKY
jgi:hypothetical protein